MKSALGNVNDLIDYLNLNKHIFQKDRNNKEHMERIMAMLTQQNMKILEKQFQLYTKGLELPTFIYLMKKLHIPQDQLAKYYFVSDLIKFFQAIDVNGDGHLQWSQFTQYIIENIRETKRPNYKNKAFQENEAISSAYSKISNEYKITKIIDTGAKNCIKKIIYLKKQMKYYVLETGSSFIRIFNGKFNKIDDFFLKQLEGNSFISDFSFDQDNQIFCALFDGSAEFCNIKLNNSIKFINQVEDKKLKNYHKVEYLPRHGLWGFFSKYGEAKYSKVSYKSRTQMIYSCQINLKLHEGLITDVLQIEDPDYILTSSMDGTIKLYSVLLKKFQTFEHISEETHSVINSKNKKGILGIDHTRQFGSYFLSYGFSTKIFVYSLDISLTKGYIGKYCEHSGNLISAKFLKSYPYVLSFDDKLSLRIWDFRTFQTIQIINCQKNFINPSKLEIIPELSECLICEKKITQFRTPSLQKKSKQINEFYNIFDFKICSLTNNIFVFTSNDVRVYNYVTGALIQVFAKLNENSFQTNITAAEFGYKSRKFFVGDAAGYVRQFDSQTGEFLQEIKPSQNLGYQHKSITKIIFLKQHSLLVVCTIDGRIMIYERDANGEFQLIRDIRQSHEELTCAAASVRYCLLATGSENGTANVWNLQKFAIQTVLVLESRIVNIAFSPIHPIMFIIEQTGIMSFFYVKPYQNPIQRYKCFLKLQNRDQHNSLQEISSFSFDLIINQYFSKNCSLTQDMSPSKHHFIISIGQKNGDISIVNLNPIIQKFQIEENHQIFNTKKSIRCEIQNAKTLISNQRNKVLSNHSYSNQNTVTMSLCQFSNKRKFSAHAEKIDQLLLMKNNSIILSTSADKKLKVWTFEGELNGVIDFFTFKKILWKVSEMNFHKKVQAIQTCIYAIKLIQNKKFSQKQEEAIKVSLLMNEFMNEKQKMDYISWIRVAKREQRPKIRTRPVKKTRSSLTKQRLSLIEKDQDHEESNSSSEQEQILIEDYFRKIRISQNQSNEEQKVDCQSISAAQFHQIYNKIKTQIKKKLKEGELNKKHELAHLEAITQKNKNLEEFIQKKTNNYLALQSSTKGKNDLISKLMHSLVTSTKENKIPSIKQDAEYEKIFRKTFEPKNRKKRVLKKQNSILYQNLTEARRKISFMTKFNSHKSAFC